MKAPNLFLAILLAVSSISPALACLWDFDTLQMERERFPDALELITGKFLRHSHDFYRWRIENRQARLKNEPDNLALYDDLAVAYDKVGQHEQAIETILRKERKQPGLYETYANLGTFRIHAGRLEDGMEYVDKAIAINPDAHFGREVYQKCLVQYVLSKRQNGAVPLPLDAAATPYQARGFAKFVLNAAGESLTKEDRHAKVQGAIKGVLGMMRFGQYDSPVLLEALGDLLLAEPNVDGKRLASRAYLKASYEVEDEAATRAFRELATRALGMQTPSPRVHKSMPLSVLERTFRGELGEAHAWYGNVRADELRWIERGLDVDKEFSAKYFGGPAVKSTSAAGSATGFVVWAQRHWPTAVVLLAVGVIAIVFAAIVVDRSAVTRRRNV